MKKIIIIILFLFTLDSSAQTGLLMQRYYISGALAVGQSDRVFPDTSSWLHVGADTTTKGILFPKVLLDSVATAKRALFVYDLKDSVLYHFDKNKRVRYMTYKDTVLLKQLIAANPPNLTPYFKEGGNAFGKTAVMGTTDNRGIDFVIDDTSTMRISSSRVWTKQGRTNTVADIPLSIGTGYEMYGQPHDSSGLLTYISGRGGDFRNGYGLVFGTPTNKVMQLSSSQIQLNQNVVVPSDKTLQLGALSSFESSPTTGLRYHASSGWNFAIRDGSNNNRLAIMSNGNVLVNSNTDDNYRFSVTGNARITEDLHLEKTINFRSATQGIQITNSNYTAFPTIIIGRNNGAYPTTGNRHIKIGVDNNSNPTRSFHYTIGNFNNLSAAALFCTAIGSFNTIQTEDHSQTIIGDYNSISYASMTTGRGQCIIGSNNSVKHMYSSVIGNFQTTTGTNQLIIADGNPNYFAGGYRDVYFGSGPVSTLNGGLGAPVTINASGGNGVNKAGGLLRLAAGKSTGAGIPPDVIFSTASTVESDSTLQSLSDRWYVKGQTGRLSNNSSPTALLDIGNATGYNQFRLRVSYTPTSSSDSNGNIGDIAWDVNYIYVRTASGWKRTTLSDF